jgi:5-formyltetrahydrofolate cyclo-ligase
MMGVMREADGPVVAGAAAKAELRAGLRAARALVPPADRAQVAAALADRVLALPELAGAGTVAGYVSTADEPGTGPVLDALVAAGHRVLLPVLLPDFDLDWSIYTSAADLAERTGRPRLREPVGDRLGVDAVAAAGLLLVPALAVGAGGLRLGQGGGSYDRALGRVARGTVVAALLYDGELLPDVPSEAHDRRVTMAVLPSGVVRFDSGGMDSGRVGVR